MKFRTMIVPAHIAPMARSLAAAMDPAASSELWATALTDGGGVTHYISTGFVSDNFAAPLPLTAWTQTEAGWEIADHYAGDPLAIVERAAQLDPPMVVTVEDVQALLDAADVSEQEPLVAMARLGLMMADAEGPV